MNPAVARPDWPMTDIRACPSCGSPQGSGGHDPSDVFFASDPLPNTPLQSHRLTLSPSDSRLDLLPQEWLLTNGSGAYAMGSVGGVNTRRYHGLLIACLQPPVGRVVVLSQMLEQFTLPGEARPFLETATCAFVDNQNQLIFAPQGHDHLTQFTKGVNTSWTYSHPKVIVTRTLHLHWKQQAITLTYRIEPKVDVQLALSPMVTLRDFHAMRHQNQDHGLTAELRGDGLSIRSHEAQTFMHAPDSVLTLNDPAQSWWYDLYYPQDNDRGQEDREDYFLPARFTHAFKAGESKTITFTAALGNAPVQPQTGDDARTRHLSPMVDKLKKCEPARATALAIAADDFVVDRTIKGQKLSTILAGYPWFADWGRDTFISLPGLLLVPGRYDEARDVLQAFAQNIRDGLVPNRFDDYQAGDAHYNTVDASLWFIDAAMQYLATTDDRVSWDQWLAPACMQIIDAYLKGTRYDIHMSGDGLITAGNPATQLTWMDAACGDTVFTPRHGKAVEINALWFHALSGMSELLAKSHQPTSEHYAKLAGRISRSFMKVFWDDKLNHLRDHVWVDDAGQEHIDTTLRPNQILAASLPHSPLPKTKRKIMLKTVADALLIPYGLRTLAPGDPHYHGHYRGPAFNRDEAYHQGTAWPWLIGPYVEAQLRVSDFSMKAKAEARQTLEPLLEFLMGAGIGQLYENHEADAPHRPVGCPAQAWSVAQVIRVLSLL